MESLGSYIIYRFLPYILPGYIYVLSIYFLILSIIGVHNKSFTIPEGVLCFLILVFIIFFSLIIGYTIHLAFDKILLCLFKRVKKKKKEIDKIHYDLKKKALKVALSKQGEVFMMLRHLVLSTLLLGITFFIWLWLKLKADQCNQSISYRNYFLFIILYLFLLIIFYLAYNRQKEIKEKTKEKIRKYKSKKPIKK